MNDRILAVQRMQDYIEQHLNETITLTDLAYESLFSPWYSYRIFKQYTGYTPADYIRRLRLSKSALQLRDGTCKISDTAFDLGFGCVDGYIRAFHREFGMTPKEYANAPVPITLFIPYGVKFQNLRKDVSEMKDVHNVFIQKIEKPQRKVIIKRGKNAQDYFTYGEEVGCDVWGTLSSISSLSGEPICLWLNERYRKPNTSVYVQGVEVDMKDTTKIPDGYDVIELPPATYLMFQGEPFAEEDYCEAIERVQHAIKNYDPSVIGMQWDHQNPRIQLEPIGTRGYIELYSIVPIK